MSMKEALKGGAITVLVLLALVGVTLAQQDLSVTSIASKDNVKPGEQIIYNIGVTNNGVGPVYDVTVTDKLPPEATYVSTTAEKVITTPQGGALPTNTLEAIFDVIPAGQTKSFNITITAPTAEEPVILYNYVLVRARNVDQNIFKETKTIVMPDYNKFRAVRSLQDLLINQSHLLLSFEDLLHMVSQNNTEHVSFLQSFEQLLKTQTVLISGFQNLLYSPDQSGWTNAFTNEQKIEFLMCYEEMLKKEAFLFSSFEDILKKNWCSAGDINTKKEFLASFEDLLHKQVTLYSSFETLLQRLGLNDSSVYTYGGVTKTGTAWKVQFLGSFEALLRLQSDLLLSFQELMNAPPCDPGITINKTAIWSKCDDCNQWVIYTITVTNTGPNNITGANLTDYYPDGAHFSKKYNPNWINNGDGTLSYSIGTIEVNRTMVVSLNLFMPPGLGLGPFVNNVCVDSNERVRVCSSVSISRNKTCPGIVVNKTAIWGTCNNGFQNAIYTIKVANKGLCNATGVRLIDTYPAGAGFSAAENPDWTDNMNGTLTYNRTVIPVNTSIAVQLVLNFSNSMGLGPFNNTVCAYTNEFPRVCSSVNIRRDNVCPVPGIQVTKTGQWGDCKNGVQNATYTIKVINTGNTTITGVKLLDTYPAGATFDSVQNPLWTKNVNGTLTYSHGDIIAPSNTLTVPLILGFSNSMGLGPFVNKVCAYTNEIPGVCAFGNISRDQLCPVSKIEVTKTGQWGNCKNGIQNATYTIKVINTGTTTITGVKLLDTYPAGATFDSVQNPLWTKNVNGTLTYSHGDIIAPSNTLTVPLILGFSNSMGLGPFVNRVCAYTNEIPGVCTFGNISRDQLCPIIEVTKTAVWSDCKNGVQNATYTIKVSNMGSTTVTGVKLLDTYPVGAMFDSVQNPLWTKNVNDTLTYSHGDIIAPSNTLTVSLILGFSNSMGLGPFVNRVCAYTNEVPGVCAFGNISRDQLCPVSKIGVTKTGQWGDCKNGIQNATYTIKVSNTGTTTITGVKLLDTYPVGATFDSVQNPLWTKNINGTLTYSHGDIIAPSNTLTVPLILGFSNSMGLGPFVNRVCAYTNEVPGVCTFGNISRDQLCPVSGIQVIKTGQWVLCDNYTGYWITVSNHGDKDATGVKLTDYPPAVAEFDGVQNPGWTKNNTDGTLTYNLSDLRSKTDSFPVPLTLFISKIYGPGPFMNKVCVDTHEYARNCTTYNLSRVVSSTGECIDG